MLTICLSMLAASPAGRLFHIERSKNKNIVCYDVQLKGTTLNIDKPLDNYWLRNETDGSREDLSFIEKKMAYGYKVVSKGNNEANVKLTAYDKQSIRICQRNGKWVGLVKINGEECQLTKIYVQANPKNSLKVLYIELTGTSTANGKVVTQRIENN